MTACFKLLSVAKVIALAGLVVKAYGPNAINDKCQSTLEGVSRSG
jgi:hypothetical protein